MDNYMPAYISTFKNDDTKHEGEVVAELVGVNSDGRVEIGWDGPNGTRCYITLPLGMLVERAATFRVES